MLFNHAMLKRQFLAFLALFSACVSAGAADEGRRYPHPVTPPFWKATVEDVALAVEEVKRGKTEII